MSDPSEFFLKIKNTRRDKMKPTVKRGSLWVSSPDRGSDSHRGRSLRNRETQSSSLLTMWRRQSVCQTPRKHKTSVNYKDLYWWGFSETNPPPDRENPRPEASCSHLAVRSGLGSVVAAVPGLWRDSWRKAAWRSDCKRCWNLDGPEGQKEFGWEIMDADKSQLSWQEIK